VIQTESGEVGVTLEMAEGIEFYLIQNGYVDRKGILQMPIMMRSGKKLSNLYRMT